MRAGVRVLVIVGAGLVGVAVGAVLCAVIGACLGWVLFPPDGNPHSGSGLVAYIGAFVGLGVGAIGGWLVGATVGAKATAPRRLPAVADNRDQDDAEDDDQPNGQDRRGLGNWPN